MSFFKQLALCGAFLLMFWSCQSAPAGLEWPAESSQSRPWTRWWWHGNSVTKADITASLEAYQKNGFGGVEITPIYGVRGQEGSFIDYLSPEWMEMLEHTLQEAQRLGLEVDMANGTGWPFGGPQVNPGQASKYLAHRTYRLSGGQRLQEAIRYRQEALVRTVGPIDGVEIREPISANPNLQALALDQVRFEKDLPLQVVMAFSDAGDKLDLTTRVDSSGHLDWVAPAGQWTLYALFQGWHGKMVERAAPGGEGYTIDHFSKTALSQYLSRFDQAFAGHNLSGLRAFFNDSYEVDDAFGNSDWTPAFFDEFEARRGYDLRNFLPALLGEGRDETHQRVLSDYRETLSDLIREMFTETWRRWAAGRGVMVRNQAHGSPGNVLDLYAASDIPETEGTRILTMKFASSAANVSGKPLVGAEAATWLDEHFRTTLAKVKENLDRFFLGGVNHVVYHGTAYSPQADEWPGRLFYAAVHFNPRNSWWEDLAALNAYVSRTQAFLQSGRPDNDILLYFPIHDRFAEPGRETLEHFGGRGGFRTSAFRALADTLQSLGYTFDYLSDRQLGNLSVADRRLRSGGNTYRAILVPQSRFMPLASFRKLRALARSGATVLFQNSLPEDVPGLGDLEARREQFKKLHKRIVFSETDRKGVQWAGLNFGAFLIGADVQQLLNFCRIPRETLPENGLAFVRRRDANGPFYFIANQGETPVEQWVDFQANGQAAAIFEPMRKNFGLVRFEPIDGRSRVYLQLQPGESCIVKMFESEPTGPAFPYLEADGEPVALDGDWEVRFVAGGPTLPATRQIGHLTSWTTWGEETLSTFSGTAHYRTPLEKPAQNVAGWMLDLGEVAQSARVLLNGAEVGVLTGPTYRIFLPAGLFEEKNELTVAVSNLMANRIIDLDRRAVPWKKFYNINFPARRRENSGPDRLFTAKHWDPLPSGLLGPVRLIPMKITH